MRDDLQEAWDAVRWAETHIAVMQERFISWQRRAPYRLVMEPDPDDADWELLTAYLRRPLDPLIVGDAGAIINSTRTALDILMFSVLARHRKKPKGNTHFPIRSSASDFLNAVDTLKSKKRVSAVEAAAIKRVKAYRGGDALLYAIHQLDILRKHERLLLVEPALGESQITLIDGASYVHRRVLDDKAILYRIPARARFRPTPGNTLLAAEVFFNEPALLVTKQPAPHVLKQFALRVRSLIEGFP